MEKVDGNVDIKGRTLKSLGTLPDAGGSLNLHKSGVENLRDLKYVGGNVLISQYNEEL